METIGGLPSRGLVFSELTEALRHAQDCAAMLAHLHQTEDGTKDKVMAMAWLSIAELLRRMVLKVTEIGQGKLQ